MSYRIFKRAWWRKDSAGKIVPNPGARKTTLMYVNTEEEARKYCREYNAENPCDWRSIKAEYEGA